MEQSLHNMKLLNKQEVEILKSNERLQTVGEGLKLAKKIDVLRETASKEESNLAKFRIETLRLIQEEIRTLNGVKTNLEEEVQALRNEKTKLQLSIKSVKHY